MVTVGTQVPAEKLIRTNPAQCRDCYRCVRVCPVKAIRVKSGQAQVVHELCIHCASCVLACPQKAKIVRDDRPAVKEAIAAGRKVIASVAPSAPGFFEMNSFAQMEQALQKLGFSGAEETAFGAEMVGLAHGELAQRSPERWPLITSSCPVIVNLIEKYYPDILPHLAPIVSPLLAHGRYLRQVHGQDAFLVFIGPCVAKKGEIVTPAVAGVIDAALTFTELEEWMKEESIVFPASAEASTPEAQRPPARLFPVEGGLVGTARMDTDILSSHILVASGIGACQNVLEGIRAGAVEASLVELMACDGGCINGPAMADQESVVLARQRVMAYAARRQPKDLPSRDEWPDLSREYHDYQTPVPAFALEQIEEVLHQVKKFSPEDELNCGACGYDSCREKAVAVLRGMAEATMCIPYMRSQAESLTNVVIEATPNAIIVVDNVLRVQDVSPSAEKMFNCNRQTARGRPLREIAPLNDEFTAVRDSGQSVLNQVFRLRKDLIVEGGIVPIKKEGLIMAILRDVTEREQQAAEMEKLRSETLQRTQGVINQQMRVAHEIASLLGETTAETKVLLTQLARLMDQPKNEPNR